MFAVKFNLICMVKEFRFFGINEGYCKGIQKNPFYSSMIQSYKHVSQLSMLYKKDALAFFCYKEDSSQIGIGCVSVSFL